MRPLTLYIAILILINLGCSKENNNVIDPEFESYVDMFFEEAQKRNLDISQEDYSFSLNFGEDTHLGVCFPGRNRILINRFYWGNLPELNRQYVIFHELGHCILDRRHDNDLLPNGECKSIMKGTEENECYPNIDNFNAWRTYYLDELFNTNADLPEWYTSEINITPFEVIFEAKDSLDESFAVDIGDIDPETNIIFEANFKEWDKSRRIILSWGNQRINCSSNSVSITDISNKLRYLKRDVVFDSDTKISFIRKDGFDYYLVDDNIIHIEEEQDNALRYIRVAINSLSSDIYKIPLSLRVSLIE